MNHFNDFTEVSQTDKAIQPDLEETTSLDYDLIHELRTPLTAIKGALGLLQNSQANESFEQEKRLLDIATKNTERLVAVITAIENDKSSRLPIFSKPELEPLKLQSELYSACNNHQFFLVYQPIVSGENEKIVGFEALVRWQHPSRGLIFPTKFIPAIEETELVHSVGFWILQQACKQLKEWQIQSPKNATLTISVNLSALQLLNPDLVSKVQEICQEAEISPRNLCLEITESILLNSTSQVTETLEGLRSLGIKIYLDDFGTGYSSLARLHEMQIDVIKIDRYFVCRKQWNIIRYILNLTQDLGLGVVTEGVENVEELAQLKALGEQNFQGYLFSKPVTAEKASQLLIS